MSHNISQITHLKLGLTLPLSLGLPVTGGRSVLLCLIKSNIALSRRFLSLSYSPIWDQIWWKCLISSARKLYDIVVKQLKVFFYWSPLPPCSSLSDLLVFFLLPFTETLMDTKWATTELAWTAHPETGVSSLCSVCVFVEWNWNINGDTDGERNKNIVYPTFVI